MKIALTLAALLAAATVLADNAPGTAVNYCHDPAAAAEWQRMLAKTPDDHVVIRLYALREGLCQMVDAGLIALDRAIDLFEQERAQAIGERFIEDVGRRQEYGV